MERDVLLQALALAHSLLNARTPNLSLVNIHDPAREKRKRGLVQMESKPRREQNQQITMGGKNTRIESTQVGLRMQMAVSLISDVPPVISPSIPY